MFTTSLTCREAITPLEAGGLWVLTGLFGTPGEILIITPYAKSAWWSAHAPSEPVCPPEPLSPWQRLGHRNCIEAIGMTWASHWNTIVTVTSSDPFCCQSSSRGKQMSFMSTTVLFFLVVSTPTVQHNLWKWHFFCYFWTEYVQIWLMCSIFQLFSVAYFWKHKLTADLQSSNWDMDIFHSFVRS